MSTDLAAFKAHRRKTIDAAVSDAGEFLLEASNRTVPHEEGTLEGSGTVTLHHQGNTTAAVVSYDTPYAARQHEDTRLRHSGKGRAKWLERTALEQRARITGFLTDRLSR